MESFIITGASRGLGLALTSVLLKGGKTVVAIVRQNTPVLAELTQAYPSTFYCEQADLAEAKQAIASLTTACQHLKNSASLTLINNAGSIAPIAQAGHYPDEISVLQTVAINLSTPILMTDAFLKATAHLNVPRRILNISSGAAKKTYCGWSVYGATKAGLDHFTQTVAAELQSNHLPVKVVSLYPGVVDTDMQNRIRQSDADQFPNKAYFEALKVQRRLTPPETVAQQIVTLLSSPAFGQQTIVDVRDL